MRRLHRDEETDLSMRGTTFPTPPADLVRQEADSVLFLSRTRTPSAVSFASASH